MRNMHKDAYNLRVAVTTYPRGYYTSSVPADLQSRGHRHMNLIQTSNVYHMHLKVSLSHKEVTFIHSTYAALPKGFPPPHYNYTKDWFPLVPFEPQWFLMLNWILVDHDYPAIITSRKGHARFITRVCYNHI